MVFGLGLLDSVVSDALFVFWLLGFWLIACLILHFVCLITLGLLFRAVAWVVCGFGDLLVFLNLVVVVFDCCVLFTITACLLVVSCFNYVVCDWLVVYLLRLVWLFSFMIVYFVWCLWCCWLLLWCCFSFRLRC